MSVSCSILGGSGYTGGELCRLLLQHPDAELRQVTSRRLRGEPIHSVHPNLRGLTGPGLGMTFVDPNDLQPCDVLFLCAPHGEAARSIEKYAAAAQRIIDLSADFRLRDPAAYRRWYGEDHAAPAWLERFVYGLPETRREEIRSATHVSGVGCNATAMNLSLLPLARAGVIERVTANVLVGSSEAGAEHSAASHHPERSGALRSYAPTGHRHQAEVVQELSRFQDRPFAFEASVTAVEMIRGVLATCRVTLSREVANKDVWAMFREAYSAEPFVRLVKDRKGLHRSPDPKILGGSNFADVGFELDESPEAGGRSVVTFCAIDNLMKGAAGTAVQGMNLMCGLDERAGLGFPGLHPI